MTSREFDLFRASVAAAIVVAGCAPAPQSGLEIYPAHSRLDVGDQIHYSVLYRRDGAPKFVETYSLESKDPEVVRVVDSIRLEAVSPGRSEVLVRSEVGERVLSIEVGPDARPPIPARHHTEVERIAGEELLFVGHANLDGWDHTAAAKPGIDRLVREFKTRGHPAHLLRQRGLPVLVHRGPPARSGDRERGTGAPDRGRRRPGRVHIHLCTGRLYFQK